MAASTIPAEAAQPATPARQEATRPPARATAVQSLRALLEKSRQQIEMALPRHLTAERMMRVVMTAVQRTPALLECSQLSLIGAVIQASQLGLEPDGMLGRAYLIPRRNRKTRQVEACFMPGYLGLIELAQRSGKVSWIAAELVWSGDHFAVKYGVDREITHVPDLDAPERLAWDAKEKDLRGLRGAYAVVKYKDGSADFEYMPKARLDALRNFSDSVGSEYSPWNSPLAVEDMYRKCPIRKLAKRCPLSSEFQLAAQLEEAAEAGVSQQSSGLVLDSDALQEATDRRREEMRAKYAPAPTAAGAEDAARAPATEDAGDFDF